MEIDGGLAYNDSSFTLSVEAIDKIPIDIEGVTGSNNEYSGSTQIGYTGSPKTGEFTGDLDHYYKGRNGTLYDSSTAPIDSGDYTVTLSIPEEADYKGKLDIDFPSRKRR